MRTLICALFILSLGLMAVPVQAAPCKDAKGRFTKCPEAKKPPVRCKDAKGKFAKCGSPGSKPA